MSSTQKVNKFEFRKVWDTIAWAMKLSWDNAKGLLIGVICTTLLSSLIPLLLALYGRGLIDTFVTLSKDTTNSIELLYPWLILGFLLTLFGTISTIFDQFFTNRLNDELQLKLSIIVIEKTATLKLGYLENPKSQKRITHVMKRNTLGRLSKFSVTLIKFGSSIAKLLSLTLLLLYVEPLLTPFLLLLIIPYLIFQFKLAKIKYNTKITQLERRRSFRYFLQLFRKPKMASEIKILNLSPLLTKKYHLLAKEEVLENRQLFFKHAISSILLAVVTITSIYGLFVRVSIRVLKGALTIGDVTVYAAVSMQLRGILENTILNFSMLREQLIYLEDLKQFLQEEADTKNNKEPKIENISSAISFEKISFTYPESSHPVLSNISFNIHAGETIAIIGKKGSGKTTLAKLIAKLYEPTDGQIIIDNNPTISPLDWYKQISFVFQETNLYKASITENIAFGNWEDYYYTDAKKEVILPQIPATISKDDIFEEHGIEVDDKEKSITSFSSQQRLDVALARAFARKKSRLLIVDVPFKNLSLEAEYELFLRIKKLAGNRTIIFLTQRYSTVNTADRILVLDGGGIIEMGNPKELLKRNGPYTHNYYLEKQNDRRTIK